MTLNVNSAEYLQNLKNRPELAVVPMVMAAEVLGVSRAAVHQQVRAKKLQAIVISSVQYILASSVQAVLDQKEAQVDAIIDFLLDCASREGKTAYGPLMEHLGMKTTTPADRRKIGALLLRASEWSKKQKVLLSALVRRSRSDIPSPGFFELAEKEGFYDPSKQTKKEFLDAHTKKIIRLADTLKKRRPK